MVAYFSAGTSYSSLQILSLSERFQTETGFSIILKRRELTTLCLLLFLFVNKLLELYLPRRIYFITYFVVLNIAAKTSGLNGNMNDSAPVQENNPKPQLLNKNHRGKGNESFTLF